MRSAVPLSMTRPEGIPATYPFSAKYPTSRDTLSTAMGSACWSPTGSVNSSAAEGRSPARPVEPRGGVDHRGPGGAVAPVPSPAAARRARAPSTSCPPRHRRCRAWDAPVVRAARPVRAATRRSEQQRPAPAPDPCLHRSLQLSPWARVGATRRALAALLPGGGGPVGRSSSLLRLRDAALHVTWLIELGVGHQADSGQDPIPELNGHGPEPGAHAGWMTP
jgi:hypothetical protein